MPIRHIVLLAFKPTLSNGEIEKIMDGLGGLMEVIPEILSFSWGENNSREGLDGGYLHGFVMEFRDEGDREVYLGHVLHLGFVGEVLVPALVEGVRPVVFDYLV